MVTQLYLAIFGLVLCGLFLNVVRLRIKNRVSLGDGGIDELQRARSIHSNFIETVPVILAMMFFMEIEDVSPVLVHGFGILMIVSRLCHFHGILTHKFAAGLARRIAGIIFITLVIAGSIILLFKYFV